MRRRRIWDLWISQKHKNLDIWRVKHFLLPKKKLHIKGYFITKNSLVAEVAFNHNEKEVEYEK